MLSQKCILTLETLPFPIPSALPPCYVQQIMFSQQYSAKNVQPKMHTDTGDPPFFHTICLAALLCSANNVQQKMFVQKCSVKNAN